MRISFPNVSALNIYVLLCLREIENWFCHVDFIRPMQKHMVKNRYAFLHGPKNLGFPNSLVLIDVYIRR